MTELEKEAREQAKKIEENQTLGVYDSDEDFEYDKGWNAGEVSGYEDGYIAGAKAHQTQWHDLRKNPFDLPSHSYRVLVFTDEGVGFGIYGLDDKKWHTYDAGFEVIAWKEILLPE